MENIESVDDQPVVMLGEDTTVTTFEATVGNSGTFFIESGQRINLHVANVGNKDDSTIALGVHSTVLNEGENIITMIENLEHSNNAN